MTYLEYPACALSILGALLVSSRGSRQRRIGFGIWILSNLLLIAWAGNQSACGMLAMYVFFLGTSLRGWHANP